MKRNFLRYLKWVNLTFLTLLTTDIILHLFQINETSSVLTLLGIRIDTVISPRTIDTMFSLDVRLLSTYLITLALLFPLFYVLDKRFLCEKGACEPYE